MYFRGAASNPLTGDLTVDSGELHFDKSGGATPYAGNSIRIGTTNVTDPTQVYLYANNQIPDGADLDILPSGALVMNNFSDNVNSVTMLSGIVDAGTGTLGINSSLNLTPRFVSGITWESPTLNGKIEFHGAACTLNVSTNACTIAASIVENGTATVLNKTGAGEGWRPERELAAGGAGFRRVPGSADRGFWSGDAGDGTLVVRMAGHYWLAGFGGASWGRGRCCWIRPVAGTAPARAR